MPERPSATTTVSAQAAKPGAGLNYLHVLACCATAADYTPRVYTNAEALLSVHGYCEGAEFVDRFTRKTRKPVLFVPMPIAQAGVIGRQNTSGNSGTCVTTLAAGPNGILAESDGVVEVESGGTIGTDQIKLKISLDGGRTFKKIRLGTASSYTIPHHDITVAFGAGTLVAGDTVHTWHATAPRWDSAGLTAARNAMAASQKTARSALVVGDLKVEADAVDVLSEFVAYATTNERFSLARAQLRDRLPYAAMSHVLARMSGAPNVTFAEVGAGNDTATRSAGSFSADGFVNGDTVRITGAVAGAGHNNIVGVANVTSPTVLTFPAAAADFDNEGPIAGVSMTAEPTLTFVDGGVGTDSLTRNRGSWIDDGFRIGDVLTITGTASNNGGTYVVTAITATTLTFATGTVTAEVIGSSVVTIIAGEIKAAWMADLDAEFADVRGAADFRLDLTAGRVRGKSELTGYKYRLPAAWVITIREYQHDIHVAPWEKDIGALDVDLDLEDADGALVEWDERLDGGGLAAGFSCLTTWANGPAGVFCSMALTRAEEGVGLQLTHNAHVANLACSVNQATTENAVGRTLVLDKDTGYATPDSLAKLKAEVVTALEGELLEDKLGEGQRASAVDWTPATDDDLRGSNATLNGVLELNLRGTIVHVNTRVNVS